MHPILFELPGGLPVRTFGVLVAAGFLFGAYLIWPRLLRLYGDDPERDPARASAVALWILIGVLGGGRLAYVAVEVLRHLLGDGSVVGEQLVQAPWEAFYVWKGGLVMYGGLFGAVLLGAWSARANGLARGTALDTGLTAGFAGQSIGRLGCLLVGDDHGSVVPRQAEAWPFPLTIRVPDHAWLHLHPESLFPRELAGETLWATQTWMSLAALAIAGVGLWRLPHRRYPGQVALLLGLLYACSRFGIELFRGDAIRGVWFDGALSTSQIVSLPLAILCAIGLWRGRRQAR